jgi:hypothetical protein
MTAWLPKEHGAYGQVTFPLVAAFGVAGLSIAGVLLAVAVVAGFLAHEPAAIALGQRGPRARRDFDRAGRAWLVFCLVVLIAAGLSAGIQLDPIVRWSLAVPVIPAAVLIVAMLKGREKSWLGEAAVALAFAGVAVPVTIAAGASPSIGWAVAIPFAVLFTTTTLAVRVVILRVRGGGDPHATATTRRATVAVAIVSILTAWLLAMAGWLPRSVVITCAPGVVTALLVAARPPAATQLRSLGWTLVAVSILTTVIVIVALRDA